MTGIIRKLALAATLVGGVALAQSTSNPTPPPPGSPTGSDTRSGYPNPPSSTDPGQGSAPNKMEHSTPSGVNDPGYGGSGDAGTGTMKKGKKAEGSSSSDSSGK